MYGQELSTEEAAQCELCGSGGPTGQCLRQGLGLEPPVQGPEVDTAEQFLDLDFSTTGSSVPGGFWTVAALLLPGQENPAWLHPLTRHLGGPSQRAAAGAGKCSEGPCHFKWGPALPGLPSPILCSLLVREHSPQAAVRATTRILGIPKMLSGFAECTKKTTSLYPAPAPSLIHATCKCGEGVTAFGQGQSCV